ESGVMVIIAMIGLFVNIVLTIVLVRSLKQEDNINVQSALWHFMGDLLNSIGVIVAVVLIHITGWQMIDPIISIIISLIILRGGWKIAKNAWFVSMEAVPEKFDIDKLIADMRSIKGIDDVHDFHLWCITSDGFSLCGYGFFSARCEAESFSIVCNHL